jgi:hypothetical protein
VSEKEYDSIYLTVNPLYNKHKNKNVILFFYTFLNNNNKELLVKLFLSYIILNAEITEKTSYCINY